MSTTVKDLKEWFAENNVPEDAAVFIHAEHSFQGDQVYSGMVSRSPLADFNEMVWEFDNYEDAYDLDALEAYPKDGKVTAICLVGE